MKTNKIFLFFAFIFTTFASAQVGIGTKNPQGIFNIDGAKDNAASGTPTATQQANDFVVLADGKVGIGKTTPGSILDIASTTGTITNTRYTASNTVGANLILQKSFNNTNLTNTAVPSGDVIGRIVWKSNTGTGFNSASSAEIRAEQVGNASTTNNGSKIVFATTPENSTNYSDRMTITDAGKVGVGTTTPAGNLHVKWASGVDQPVFERTAAGGGVSASGATFLLNNTTATFNGHGIGINFAYKSDTESEKTYASLVTKIKDYTAGTASLSFIVGGGANINPQIAMTIDANKNVGIGTETPTSKLHVVGLPVHANNAAAITAGRTVGAFYHNGDGVVRVVF